MALGLAPTLEVQETPIEKKEEINSLFETEVKVANPIESVNTLSEEQIANFELSAEVGPPLMIQSLGQNITGEVFDALEKGQGDVIMLNSGNGMLVNPESGAVWWQAGEINLDATGEQIKETLHSGDFLKIEQKFQSHLDANRGGQNFASADDYRAKTTGADDSLPELYRVPLEGQFMYVEDKEKGDVEEHYSIKDRKRDKGKRYSAQDQAEIVWAQEGHTTKAEQEITPEESAAQGLSGKKYKIEKAIETTGFTAESKKGGKNEMDLEGWDPELPMRSVIYEEAHKAMGKLAFKQKIMITEKNFENEFRPIVSIPGKLHVLQVVNPQKPGIVKRNGKLKIVRGAELMVIAKNENGKWKGAGFGRGSSGWRIDAWMKNKEIDL